jgi:hypothetical protein
MILILLLMSLYDYRQHRASIADLQNVTPSYAERDLFPEPLGSTQPNRVIYPYSVIPGGAHTLTELQAAEVDDSVVREHYAGFDHTKFRIIRLGEEKRSYVSYRLGNEVFWTKNKLRLPAGEELMTDGAHYARTRCGNRLSDVPHGQTSPRQPPVAQLETPVPEELPRPEALFSEEPPAEPPPAPVFLAPAPGSRETSVPRAASGPGLPASPLFLSSGHLPPPRVTPKKPPKKPPRAPSPVPEPGTLWLLSSALGGFALYIHKASGHPRRGSRPSAFRTDETRAC